MGFTEATSESWFSRIGSSIKGILIGSILFLVAFPVQFMNEGRAVYRSKTLAEGKGAVIGNVSEDSVDSANEGKLIHMIGQATATGNLTDQKFAVSIENGLRLKRNVEMYQWHENVSSETKKKLGGGTTTEKTYSYRKGWSGAEVDSSNFHDGGQSEYGNGNPPMPFQSETMTSDKITIGAFRLSQSLSQMISKFETFDVSDQLENVPAAARQKLVANGGGFYLGADPNNPQIGDVRVTYSCVRPLMVSIFSQQSGETFIPYTNTNGVIERLELGEHSVEQMFGAMEAENTILTWFLRVLGLVMMVAGLNLVLSPLAVLADVVPFIGNIMGAGTMFVSVLVGCFFSLITISIAWIFYRPLIGLTLLAIAIGIVVILYKRSASNKSRTESAAVADSVPANA